MDRDGGADLPSDIAQMAMVAQIDHLPERRIREQTERFLGAEIVEGFQDIVGDEGNRTVAFDEFPIAGDTQRKI